MSLDKKLNSTKLRSTLLKIHDYVLVIAAIATLPIMLYCGYISHKHAHRYKKVYNICLEKFDYNGNRKLDSDEIKALEEVLKRQQ